MATNNTDSIKKELKGKSEGLSATAIAHAIGFSKSASIMKDLNALIENGSVELVTGGRYDLYKLASKAVEKKSNNSVDTSDKNEKVTIVEGEKVSEKLPEAASSELRGFTVNSILYKGDPMKKITTPDGKKIRIQNDEKLLVINNDPKYVVKTAEDVVLCIRKYAADNNLNVFTIDDMKMNRKIANEKDVIIKDDHIMFLSIKKHNKAARVCLHFVIHN